MIKSKYDFTDPKAIKSARTFLIKTTNIFEKEKLPYFLEAGTLLGIVRDKDLIPWDHDVDLCITSNNIMHLLNLRWKFLLKGYKFSVRKNPFAYGPVNKGDVRMVKIKPIFPYLIKAFQRGAAANFPVIDVFVKYSDNENVFWQVEGHVLRISKKYYESHELLPFFGATLRAPQNYIGYLTDKYGDWKVPVKDWTLKTGDFTIID